MKLLIVGDLHLSDQKPASRTDDYLMSGLVKLAHIVPIYRQHEPDAVLFLGDIFHRKRPNLISHFLVNKVNSILEHLGRNIFCLLGNHDCPTDGKDLSYYPIHSLNFTVMIAPASIPGCNVQLIPYGANLPMTTEAIVSEYARAHNELFETNILCVHGPLAEPGMAPFEIVNLKAIALSRPRVDICLFGHMHKRYGPKTFANTVFFNPGALMRISVAKSDIELEPAVGMLDTGTKTIQVLSIPCKPVEQVLRIREHLSNKEREAEAGAFVDSLIKYSVDTVGIEAIIRAVESVIEVPDEIRQTAIGLLRETA